VEPTSVQGWFKKYNHSGPPPPLVKLRMERGGPENVISVDLICLGYDVYVKFGWVDLG
jgi:hypothetical protein